MSKINYNVKKLFKGENVYGFGKDDYSYASTEAIAIRIKKNSPVHEAIKADIKFMDWDERRPKELVKQTVLNWFSKDHKLHRAYLSKLYFQMPKNEADIFIAEDNTSHIIVQKKYIDVLDTWGSWSVNIGEGRNPPLILDNGNDITVIIMPFINAVFPIKEIEMLYKAVKGD